MKFRNKLLLFIILLAVIWWQKEAILNSIGGSLNKVSSIEGIKDVTGKAVDFGKKTVDNAVVPSEESNKPEVYFCPRDDCAGKMISWLGAAEESIHCALFDINLKDLIEFFDKKAKEIDVKIVVDNDNYADKFKGLKYIKQDNKNQLSHNKFCVIDGYIVWTGSFNPTDNGNFKNNNNVVVYVSEYLGKNYEDEFSELWTGKFGKGTLVKHPKVKINNVLVENYFCPEDWCANKVISALADANESIYFMTFSFTHDQIGKMLIKKAGEGVRVKGVFEESQNNKYSEYEKLMASGIEVKWDTNRYNMHHKVFIIDKKTVVTGSFNPTQNGDETNDENILIIHDKEVASRFLEEFELVWKTTKQ